MSKKRLREVPSWRADAKREIEIEEDLLACRLIVLKIVRYMKENHLSQKELAEKLNVSPQYINKFLHGRDLDMKVSTAFRYGRILGIKLLELPRNNQTEETLSSYGSTTVKTASAQPAFFDYMNEPPVFPFVMPIIRKDVARSGASVS